MMYDDAVRYLLTLGSELASPRHARAAKFDLRNITALAERLGSPHRAYPCVHIAGTNGKGSTAAMLESILRAASYRTGLYTSPHLARINERIRVNGADIPDDDFAAAFTRLLGLIEELLASGELQAHPTFFECVTAMAFDYFAGDGHSEESALAFCRVEEKADPSSRQKPPGLVMTTKRNRVDIAIFEVGMGGRLDSTNIVTPEVAVITQIDFDHENFLGHSIEEIAAEKAGIIKPGAWVVSAAERSEARAVIARRAAEQQARLVEVDAAWRVEQFGSSTAGSCAVVADGASGARLELFIPLPGRFQLRNALAAATTARLLAERGYRLDDGVIACGIAGTRWPGRLELLQENPPVYLDGTHNPAGARELLAFWEQHFTGRRIHLVYGSVRDKAVDEITGLLFPHAASVILTEPRQPRVISAEALAAMTAHLAAQVEVVADPRAALDRAIALAAPSDVVFVTGSLYLAGALRRAWLERAAVPAH
jgi:dihydrofolate synthase/folylpolyglutamate synthase